MWASKQTNKQALTREDSWWLAKKRIEWMTSTSTTNKLLGFKIRLWYEQHRIKIRDHFQHGVCSGYVLPYHMLDTNNKRYQHHQLEEETDFGAQPYDVVFCILPRFLFSPFPPVPVTDNSLCVGARWVIAKHVMQRNHNLSTGSFPAQYSNYANMAVRMRPWGIYIW